MEWIEVRYRTSFRLCFRFFQLRVAYAVCSSLHVSPFSTGSLDQNHTRHCREDRIRFSNPGGCRSSMQPLPAFSDVWRCRFTGHSDAAYTSRRSAERPAGMPSGFRYICRVWELSERRASCADGGDNRSSTDSRFAHPARNACALQRQPSCTLLDRNVRMGLQSRERTRRHVNQSTHTPDC